MSSHNFTETGYSLSMKKLLVLTEVQVADANTPEKLNRLILTTAVVSRLFKTFEIVAYCHTQPFYDHSYASNWHYRDTHTQLRAGDEVKLMDGRYFHGEDEVICLGSPTERSLVLKDGKYRQWTAGASVYSELRGVRVEEYANIKLLAGKKFYHAGEFAIGGTPVVDLCLYEAVGVNSEELVTGKTVETDLLRERVKRFCEYGMARQQVPVFHLRAPLQTNMRNVSLVKWGLPDGSDGQKVWEAEGMVRESYATPHWTKKVLHPPRFNPYFKGKGARLLQFYGPNHLAILDGKYLERPNGLPLCTSWVPQAPPTCLCEARTSFHEEEIPSPSTHGEPIRTYIPSPWECSEAWIEVHIWGDILLCSKWVIDPLRAALPS